MVLFTKKKQNGIFSKKQNDIFHSPSPVPETGINSCSWATIVFEPIMLIPQREPIPLFIVPAPLFPPASKLHINCTPHKIQKYTCKIQLKNVQLNTDNLHFRNTLAKCCWEIHWNTFTTESKFHPAQNTAEKYSSKIHLQNTVEKILTTYKNCALPRLKLKLWMPFAVLTYKIWNIWLFERNLKLSFHSCFKMIFWYILHALYGTLHKRWILCY